MGKERVPIDKITWYREPSFGPVDDLDPLRKSIQVNGLKVLPLVDENYVLIDGARRLKVLAEGGDPTVQVLVSKDFDFTVLHLRRAHRLEQDVARPVSLRRLYEVYRAVRPQIKARSTAGRVKAAQAQRNGAPITRSREARLMLTEALGVAIGHQQVAVTLYMAWENLNLPGSNPDDVEFLRSLLTQLETGAITPYVADGAWRKYLARVPEGLVTITDQETILANTAKTLTGITRATAGLGSISSDHDLTKLRAIDEEIRRARTHLHRLSADLAKAIKEGTDQQ